MVTLITGSRGFIASQLHISNSIRLDIKPSDIVHDIRYPLNIDKVTDIDSVVHLAAITGIEQCEKNKKLAHETNVKGTRNIIDFVRKNDVEKLVFASSASVYRNLSYYANLKLTSESDILLASAKYGFTASILRFANVYGKGFPYKEKVTVIHKFILQALLGNPLNIFGGNQVRDFVNVEDVCSAINYCLNNKVQGIRYVGTQKLTSINELAELIQKIMKEQYNRKITIKHQLVAGDKPFKLELLKDHLDWNWKPQIELEQGILEIFEKLSD